MNAAEAQAKLSNIGIGNLAGLSGYFDFLKRTTGRTGKVSSYNNSSVTITNELGNSETLNFDNIVGLGAYSPPTGVVSR